MEVLKVNRSDHCPFSTGYFRWLSSIFAPHPLNASTHTVRVSVMVRVSVRIRVRVRFRDGVRSRARVTDSISVVCCKNRGDNTI